MRRVFLLVIVVTTVVAPSAAALVLTNATIVDAARGKHVRGMTIVIEGERIAAVFPSASCAVPDGAVVHDLDGAFVIPGLIEAHTHMTPLVGRSPEAMRRELARMLYGGIVAARDMAGNIPRVRQALPEDGRAPDLVHAAVMGGAHFTEEDRRAAAASAPHPPGAAPWARTLTSETDLAAAVAGAKASGARAIKLYAELDATLVRAAAEEAHRQGLAVWAHGATFPAAPIDIVRAGTDVVSHVCSLGWADPDSDVSRITKATVQQRPAFDPARVDPSDPAITAVLDEMARRGTILDATLANHLRPGDDAAGCTSELMVALAKRAHAAGVRLATGTDFAAPEESAWPSLHLEIEALVREDVLTPAEALVAATVHGAAALGLADDYGAIEPGRLASLVVLARDPLEDPGALRSVVSVVKRGVVYPRAEYDR